MSPPAETFEAWITDPAEHHERKEEHQGSQREFPRSDLFGALFQPEHEKGKRRDEPCRRGDGEADKVFRGLAVLRVGVAVESRQAKRAAQQVNEGDKPARSVKVAQHDLINQQGRRYSKGNHIRERVEFPPEGTLTSAQPGEPAVEQVKHTGSKNEGERLVIESSR